MKKEIRPIHADEAPQFLNLLCSVFELDYDRASSIFFSEPFFDLKRKWALFQDGQMTTILTTTPLEFGWGSAIGIAGVATAPECRGHGYGQELLEHVIGHSEAGGEKAAILFAHEETLYRRVGFQATDEVIRGHIVRNVGELGDELPKSEVQRIYQEWSDSDPGRLRRDERRWQYWSWVYRSCEKVGAGYICNEPSIVREAILDQDHDAWPVMHNSEFFGMKSMARQMKVPLVQEEHHLIVMTRNFPVPPQMFMTDQF
ncbi:MAG: GNAT family N-acetyltransferase [Armatimonadetes bacterium]|nr:GNAT family N-acetyltransferase [Armatimonadota bacterium]